MTLSLYSSSILLTVLVNDSTKKRSKTFLPFQSMSCFGCRGTGSLRTRCSVDDSLLQNTSLSGPTEALRLPTLHEGPAVKSVHKPKDEESRSVLLGDLFCLCLITVDTPLSSRTPQTLCKGKTPFINEARSLLSFLSLVRRCPSRVPRFDDSSASPACTVTALGHVGCHETSDTGFESIVKEVKGLITRTRFL